MVQGWKPSLFIGSLAFASMGCWPHVEVPTLPDRSAPIAARFAAYRSVRPIIDDTWGFRLANGMAIHHAEDLLPLVDPASPTGLAATRLRSSARTSRVLTLVGIGLFATGGALLIADQQDLVPSGWIGIALMVAGVATGLAIPRGEIGRDANAVYLHFDQALRQRLELCGEGAEPIVCPTPVASPAVVVSAASRGALPCATDRTPPRPP